MVPLVVVIGGVVEWGETPFWIDPVALFGLLLVAVNFMVPIAIVRAKSRGAPVFDAPGGKEVDRVVYDSSWGINSGISNALKAQWDGLGFDAKAFLGDVGLAHPAGEMGFSALEMIWSRPTA